MREIKFRIWIIKLGCFMHTDTMSNVFLGELQAENNRDWIVEQFTSLRDKNGKEIYEGDIVKITHVRLISDGPVHQPRMASIEWSIDDCGFRLVGPNVRSTNPDLYPVSHLEVIGNRHESPELLTGHA